MPYFSTVTSVVFCSSLSGCNQVCEEDLKTNRMHESLKLFSDVANSKWFINTPIILFLNKADIFKEQLAEGKRISDVAFPNYDGIYIKNKLTPGADDFESCVEYIGNQFKKLVVHKGQREKLYIRSTVATDPENIDFVWNSVRDIFTVGHLEDGL